MVFFQNTSQKCWLTNDLRNLAIALWLIFKKKKQWNKIHSLGPIYFFLLLFLLNLTIFLPSPQCCLCWLIFVSGFGRGSGHGPKAEPTFARRVFVSVTPVPPCAVPGWCSAVGTILLLCPHPPLQHPQGSCSARAGLKKVCDYLRSHRERAGRNAVTHWKHFGDGNDVRNQAELHKALHLLALTESRASYSEWYKLTQKMQFRR